MLITNDNMRFPTASELNEIPPPPYTAHVTTPPHSPTATGQTESPTAAAFPGNSSIRGGYIRPSLDSNDSTLTSAVTYFDERPCAIQTPADVVEVSLFLPPGIARESIEFPKPADRYQARDVTIEDWSTFVNYLFPIHAGRRNEKQKALQDEKNKFAVTEEESNGRRQRIKTVTSVWNEGFFGPRGIHVRCEVPSNEAPPYQSTADLSTTRGISMPLRPSRPAAPSMHSQQAETQRQSRQHQSFDQRQQGNWQRRNERCGPFSHQRSSSISSSSSSSSSSSDSSIDSISSHDLEGSNLSQIRATLTSLRTDRNLKSDLKSTIRQLRTDLKAQRRVLPRAERKQHSRELKADFHAQKHEIKKEVKSMVKEFKAARKSERKSHKTERQCRRAERHAVRQDFRTAKRHHRHPGGPFFPLFAPAADEAAACGPTAHDAHARSVAAHNQDLERDLAAREQAMEARMAAREKELRAREVALEDKARERERERVVGGGWGAGKGKKGEKDG